MRSYLCTLVHLASLCCTVLGESKQLYPHCFLHRTKESHAKKNFKMICCHNFSRSKSWTTAFRKKSGVFAFDLEIVGIMAAAWKVQRSELNLRPGENVEMEFTKSFCYNILICTNSVSNSCWNWMQEKDTLSACEILSGLPDRYFIFVCANLFNSAGVLSCLNL